MTDDLATGAAVAVASGGVMLSDVLGALATGGPWAVLAGVLVWAVLRMLQTAGARADKATSEHIADLRRRVEASEEAERECLDRSKRLELRMEMLERRPGS